MADYWVATDGDDGDPGTELEPWATAQYAADTAVAGDTVYFKDGTWDISTVIDFDTNSGSDGSPIVFEAVNPGDATWALDDDDWLWYCDGVDWLEFRGLDFQGNTGYSAATLTRLYDCNHIIFDDCEFEETAGRGLAIWGNCTDIEVDGCVIHPESTNDYDGIIIQYSGNEDIHIHDCTIYHTAHNGIGVKGADGLIIEDCLIYDIHSHGISINKGEGAASTNVIIRDNVIHGTENWGGASGDPHEGIRVAEEAGDVEIYRNECYACDGRGIEVWNNCTGPIKIWNNVIYDCNKGQYAEGSWQFYDIDGGEDPPNPTVFFQNNIIYHTESGGDSDYVMTVSSDISDNLTQNYNCWYSTGVTAFRRNGTTYANAAAYSAVYESNSVFDNPDMTNPAGGDFTLTAVSPAINAGVEVGGLPYHDTAPDCGANEYSGSSVPGKVWLCVAMDWLWWTVELTEAV